MIPRLMCYSLTMKAKETRKTRELCTIICINVYFIITYSLCFLPLVFLNPVRYGIPDGYGFFLRTIGT